MFTGCIFLHSYMKINIMELLEKETNEDFKLNKYL